MTAIFTTYQQRCHCRKAGHRRLEEVCGMLATLYNAALQHRRDAYRMAGISISRQQQEKEFTQVRGDSSEWRDLDVRLGRGALRRLDLAMLAFFRRVKAGEKPGFPQFQSVARFRCIDVITPSRSMVRVASDGRKALIHIKGLPTLQLRLKQPLPDSDRLKSLRLVHRPNGWYADLVYFVERPPLPVSGEAVSMRFEVGDRVTLSTGETVHWRKDDQDRERRLRQAVSRKQPHSRRRSKAVMMLSRETRRKQVQNRNECHRISSDIIRRFGRIEAPDVFIPDLVQKAGPAKREENREIYDQTWGLLRAQLQYKAEWAGREFVVASPQYTSQECSECATGDEE